MWDFYSEVCILVLRDTRVGDKLVKMVAENADNLSHVEK